MAITRAKKEEIVLQGKSDLAESRVVLFADFKGTGVEEMKQLREKLQEVGVTYRVIKKRLMRVILKDAGIDFDPVALEGQIGVAFAKHDISEVAQPVYQFAKAHETFEIKGGVDVSEKKEIPLATILAIGNLPSRTELYASVIGSIAAPIRGLVYALSEKSKK